MAQEETKEGTFPGERRDDIAQPQEPTGAAPAHEPAPEQPERTPAQPEPTTPEPTTETAPPEVIAPEPAAPAEAPPATDTPETPAPEPPAEEPPPPEKLSEPAMVNKVLSTLVRLIGIKARIEVSTNEQGYYANIKTRHSTGLLIGHRGGTLRSLQYLTRIIVRQDYPDVPMITVDVSGYRVRRENFLRKKATAVARIVMETGREMALDLLTEKEMEIVQDALKEMATIRVYALGTGTRRNIIIAPTHE